ncbi:DUF262 domain-containing protein [Marinobacter sp. M3C]|jgi:hypothetical protein|uniref:DUF262 domain-containing protein n=1 Tax=Marinobacter sp. M3C TaxID=2917715 RepID=UPI00200BE3CB|nr:DUF262 domain-containing protein [Marinobacter sp. M3C]UQG60890.1 DUF262 domain-containing protein [Marinobacter sp. M3C]
MYQAGGTIALLMDQVKKHELILPAIQREFVWKPEQICNLFDSLLQGYPFGVFLFWRILPENRGKYRFYDFVTDYHQRDNPHCPPLKNLPERELVAVLDGQQRITALNIGLRGSYSQKVHGKWWSSSDAFPLKRLYINLLGQAEEETGSQYQFEFLTDKQSKDRADDAYWFRVGRILEEDRDDLNDELNDDWKGDRDVLKSARGVLRHLVTTIFDKDKIAYYEEKDQDLERVLNIFIRMNSGGTILSYSDLLLSIAVAQWNNLDAREEIHALVDEMNETGDGFSYSKDLVLKAGLMLSDIGSVGFKVENFNKANMAILEENWSDIRNALLLATELLATFGFNSQNLRADSVILPIAYYLYARKLDGGYLSRSEFAKDRESLRQWLIKSLLKASGIWGSGLDTLLTGLRRVLQEEGQSGFPADKLGSVMASRGKSLHFVDEEIEELAELEYGGKRTFALLSLLFPGFDFSRHFHVDHIYPKGLFSTSKLKKAGVPEEKIEDFKAWSNRLPNLQLLEGTINNEKRQKMPSEWYEIAWPDPDAHLRHLHSQGIDLLPDDIKRFDDFYAQRKAFLMSRIQQVVNS